MKKVILAFLFACIATAANAVTCNWQGGSATWDNSNTASWSCGHVPTSADAVFFGSGLTFNVTVGAIGPITIQSMAFGNFTGTFDNSVNNNNFNITAAAGVAASNTTVRTLKFGTAVWTLSGNGALWSFPSTSTNITIQASNTDLVFTGTSGGGGFDGGVGSPTYKSITLASNSGVFVLGGITTPTVGSVSLTAPIYLSVGSISITNPFNWNGSSGSLIGISSGGIGATTTIGTAVGSTINYADVRDIAATNPLTLTNSFNLSAFASGVGNMFFTAGSGACILGGWLLWRDMPDHLNDNFPAWLEKAA